MIYSTCAPAACAWQNQGMRVAYKPPSFYFKQGPLLAAIRVSSCVSCWLLSECFPVPMPWLQG